MSASETMSTEEAGRRLGVSGRYVADQCLARRWPGCKIGRQWRLTEDDIAQIIAGARREPLPKPVTTMTRTTLRRSKAPR